MVPVLVVGTAAWAVVVAAAGGPAEWLRVCVAGVLVGLPGIVLMAVRDRRRARRRAREG